jgi:hypothetical protein|tara:strand:+ start:441 stop:764 length:324 start_codon:yes stop_codon:yes gene_type:complete
MKKIASLIIIIFFSAGCKSYQELPASHFVKVLGITSKGDTIQVNINSLRPKIYQYNTYYRTYQDIDRGPRYNYDLRPRVVVPVFKHKPKPKPLPFKPILKPTIKPKN